MDSYKPIILLLAEALALALVIGLSIYFSLKGVFGANVKWYKVFLVVWVLLTILIGALKPSKIEQYQTSTSIFASVVILGLFGLIRILVRVNKNRNKAPDTL
ncbi:hypothetical protein [Pedobacter sp. R20-19]|uniref:hypothetical protein n=1 Tax=Pedobacter sp. R20-19 TaxID=1270196 RepID=UPI0004936FCE|nr:hypothetical protein [Pedobacter sp. R20-19]